MADFGISEIAALAASSAAEAGTAAASSIGSAVASPSFAGYASLAGTGLSAIGALNTAAATAADARYKAQVAKNNEIIANQNAQYASQAGAAATTRAQLKQRAELGAIGAGLAASGLDINTGSPAAVRESASGLTQLDTATTAGESALRVYGFRTNATNYGAEAGLRQSEARQADIAGPLSAGSTFLSGVGGLAAKWKPWQTSALGDWSPRGDA